MWFPLSLLALVMLTARRSAEKKVAKNVDTMALTWLQQAMAIPFIIATLFLAKFYWPSELPIHFWKLIIFYVVLSSFDLYLYFKALTIADISYVAPLLSLVAVGNIIISGQKKSSPLSCMPLLPPLLRLVSRGIAP